MHLISLHSLHEEIFDEESFKVPAGEQLQCINCLDPQPSKSSFSSGRCLLAVAGSILSQPSQGDFGFPAVCKEWRSINSGGREKEKKVPFSPGERMPNKTHIEVFWRVKLRGQGPGHQNTRAQCALASYTMGGRHYGNVRPTRFIFCQLLQRGFRHSSRVSDTPSGFQALLQCLKSLLI